MLNGFANEDMGQNRFMARTRELNSNFSYAIGTKEVTPLPDRFSKSRQVPTIYANAYGNPVQRATRPLVYNPYANADAKTTYVKPSPTPPINAIPNCTGHTNSKACMSCAGSSVSGCPQSSGNYAVDWGVSEYAGQQCGCSYNPPLLGGTKPTSFTNTAVKFDGGFANAYGNPVVKGSRPLVYNPYKNASGDCGCGCSDNSLLGL
jgi:hypothetical protein